MHLPTQYGKSLDIHRMHSCFVVHKIAIRAAGKVKSYNVIY